MRAIAWSSTSRSMARRSGIELVEAQRQRADLVRIVARQQACAEIGLADPSAGIDPRPQQEAQMIGARRLAQPRHVGKRREAGVAALLHHLQALAARARD